MSSYLATNYKYIVYLLIRSSVSKYRTNTVLRQAKIQLSKEHQRELRRLMRNFLQKLAEESYAEILKSFDGMPVEDQLQQLEVNGYLGDIEFRGADILRDAIQRRDRQLEALQQINQQCGADIEKLQREIEEPHCQTG